MSGLVAAINLARDGYAVTVHDQETGYGGSPHYNPSLHMTPLDVEETSHYLGIDISSAFLPLTEMAFYFHDQPLGMPVKGIYAVERGDRPGSLDTLLYAGCRALGVDFVWGSKLDKTNIGNLPSNTIIACGMDPATYRLMGIPHMIWEAWVSSGPTDLDPLTWAWMSEGFNEYGYMTTANGMYFDMLFAMGQPVSKDCLKRYQEFMARIKGAHHHDWKYVTGANPLGSVRQPRLFHGNAILCGTISGCLDPICGFGISGALVSGKVAALAVTDRARAETDFRRFTRKYAIGYMLKKYLWWKFMRPHVGMIEKSIHLLGAENIERCATHAVEQRRHCPSIIPGFNVLGCH